MYLSKIKNNIKNISNHKHKFSNGDIDFIEHIENGDYLFDGWIECTCNEIVEVSGEFNVYEYGTDYHEILKIKTKEIGWK